MYSSAKLMGGLGNQMFQIAHAYTQALTAQSKGLDVTARFNIYVDHLSQFPERQAANYQTNILQRVNFTPFTAEEEQSDWEVLSESGFSYNELAPVWDKSTRFHGYFQSQKYFKQYSHNVRELFTVSDNFKINMLQELPQLAGNMTAIFVRRGDYLNYPEIHPPITEEYLQQAIKVNADTSPENYLVMSDDHVWCNEILPKYLPKNKIINAAGADWQQLWLASLCNNFICANSTFGWWSAFLSKHEKKQIIFPAKWFGPSGVKNWQDIYLENSIII